jgi:hypothetical protein
MAGASGPDLVQDGLVLCLDAADKNSYSGSGTTWTDVSGNNRIGTLTNGPTFNSGNNGYITFDGVDDFTDITFVPAQTDSPLSVFSWVYLTSLPTLGVASGIWGHYGVSGNCHFEMYTTNSRLRLGNINNSSLPVFSVGVWTYAGFTSTGSDHIYYVNAQSQATWSGTTGVILGNPSSTVHMVGRSDVGRTWIGRIATTSVYTKTLSSTEVLQNYNATKTRFGII